MFAPHSLFNPNKTGGKGAMMAPLDISRDNSAMRKALATTLYDNFISSFPAHFDTKFVTPGGMVTKLRNFLYMHVGPKKAQNVILY